MAESAGDARGHPDSMGLLRGLLDANPEQIEKWSRDRAAALAEERSKRLSGWMPTTNVDDILEHGDPLMLVLRVHIRVESAVRAAVDARMKRPEELRRAQKHWEHARLLSLVVALGALSSDLAEFLRRIADLRNNLAHRQDAVPTKSDMKQVIAHGFVEQPGSLVSEMASALFGSTTTVARFRACMHVAWWLAEAMAERAQARRGTRASG